MPNNEIKNNINNINERINDLLVLIHKTDASISTNNEVYSCLLNDNFYNEDKYNYIIRYLSYLKEYYKEIEEYYIIAPKCEF